MVQTNSDHYLVWVRVREQIRNISRAEGKKNKLWNLECIKLREEISVSAVR